MDDKLRRKLAAGYPATLKRLSEISREDLEMLALDLATEVAEDDGYGEPWKGDDQALLSWLEVRLE